MEALHPSETSEQTFTTGYEHPTNNHHLHINFVLFRMQAVQFYFPHASTRMQLVIFQVLLLQYQHEMEYFSDHSDVKS